MGQSSSRQHQHKAAGLVKLSSCLLTGPKVTAKHVRDLMHRGYLVGRQNHSEYAWRLWCVVLEAAEG